MGVNFSESKVQKVARGVHVQKKRVGTCGHEIQRVKYCPHKGHSRLRWYCETCPVEARLDEGR